MANLKLKDLIKKNNFFVIAESGSNHEGSIDDAVQLIREASKAGANAVKFQSFTSKTLFAHKEYTKILKIPENALDNVDDIVLKKEWYETLYKEANKNKIILMSTPFSVEAVDDMDKYVPIYKIASCDIDNIPLLRKVASTKKPVILSTGLATNKDIKNALNILKNNEVALLHCSVEYPTPLENARLNRIVVMNKLFKKNIIGYSDHTIGIDAPIIAYTLGAKIIEKHFTITPEKKSGDHIISLDTNSMKEMILKLKDTNKMLGGNDALKNEKKMSKQEKKELVYAKRGIYLNHSMLKNEVITEKDLITLRPCVGISAKDYDKVVGKKLKLDKKSFTALSTSDLKK
ncbi:N-acetylneuraminate synthase family protein [Brachyspira pilosicoli]|uniref:N-acetylneuraminate synthase family protein n=1 Tax=Brachyspira pilosicoli TaxID=52584 RepID=A0AAJ6KBH2_BRAPL|nr:N-acetylneuraminate synthase family protein [Brachyspira pilosicoli]MBW5377319.1 shikimate kinase [Brachyspira pilosicoli]WIH80850.1 N-acetylneuraminate synthase family protein [Brachyspira pilosicoli]WIH85291.1 N-acetylneuraminate synthase family protein [Brachyspira pilosicoli]WIH87549.1 N-acetylneuraminate synthase family protein [Brachyspira pilosicoli]WIH89828.1 N-acetylneuraminate synthase family protein [Brachyspira pilosicoli]